MILYINNIGSYLHYSLSTNIYVNENDSVTMLESIYFMYTIDGYYNPDFKYIN